MITISCVMVFFASCANVKRAFSLPLQQYDIGVLFRSHELLSAISHIRFSTYPLVPKCLASCAEDVSSVSTVNF